MSVRERKLYRDVYARLRSLRDGHPGLQEPLRLANKVLRVKPAVRFRGWGMTSNHAPPWEDDSAQWWRSVDEAARRLEYTGEAGIDSGYLDELRWRHWILAWAVRHAAAAPRQGELCLVECGVADGTTAFFALATARHAAPDATVEMHLYDAWGAMEAAALLPSEQVQAGRYDGLSLEITRRNLASFANACHYHVGHVPDTFSTPPRSPEAVSFVHVDLNSAGPTRAVCEFFWPRLLPGGVMLFDDYAWLGFEDTKRVVDDFFADKAGTMLPLPTAQGAFLRSHDPGP